MKKHILSTILLFVSLTIAAQENYKTVTGQIVDAATKKPLAGVIVAAYGNNRFSVITDDEGLYTLSVPDYVSSLQMRIDGYNFTQCPITD